MFPRHGWTCALLACWLHLEGLPCLSSMGAVNGAHLQTVPNWHVSMGHGSTAVPKWHMSMGHGSTGPCPIDTCHLEHKSIGHATPGLWVTRHLSFFDTPTQTHHDLVHRGYHASRSPARQYTPVHGLVCAKRIRNATRQKQLPLLHACTCRLWYDGDVTLTLVSSRSCIISEKRRRKQ